MKILLDTQIFLWAIIGDKRLSKVQSAAYLDQTNDLYLSVASIWEMLIKYELGKLPLPSPAADYILRQMETNRIAMLAIRAGHLVELEKLPPYHRDPFDQMLVAQARSEGMPILSADKVIRKYGTRVL